MKQRKFMSLGLIFVIVGVLWLLQEMGIISGGFWGYVIPVMLILFGLDLLQKDDTKSHAWFKAFNMYQPEKEKKDRKIVDEQ